MAARFGPGLAPRGWPDLCVNWLTAWAGKGLGPQRNGSWAQLLMRRADNNDDRSAHQNAPMLKALLSAPIRPAAVTLSVYPFPSWSMLRSENVATPFTAATVFVPDSVPGTSRPPLCPIAIVTEPVKLGTGLPWSSTAATCTG